MWLFVKDYQGIHPDLTQGAQKIWTRCSVFNCDRSAIKKEGNFFDSFTVWQRPRKKGSSATHCPFTGNKMSNIKPGIYSIKTSHFHLLRIGDRSKHFLYQDIKLHSIWKKTPPLHFVQEMGDLGAAKKFYTKGQHAIKVKHCLLREKCFC